MVIGSTKLTQQARATQRDQPQELHTMFDDLFSMTRSRILELAPISDVNICKRKRK
jgi:hypothetical protein